MDGTELGDDRGDQVRRGGIEQLAYHAHSAGVFLFSQHFVIMDRVRTEGQAEQGGSIEFKRIGDKVERYAVLPGSQSA